MDKEGHRLEHNLYTEVRGKTEDQISPLAVSMQSIVNIFDNVNSVWWGLINYLGMDLALIIFGSIYS